MRLKKAICLFTIVMLVLAGLPINSAFAQTATPIPLPAPNALLIYDKTTVALINTSSTSISLAGLTFMRAGGVIKFNMAMMGRSLDPGHCIQVWTNEVRQIIGQPPECTKRDRWQVLGNANTYFWKAGHPEEPFRPQLNNSALTICRAALDIVERCAFHIPQGEDANQPWTVLDPATGQPMPAGLQVAHDAHQLWIGNFTPNTILPTPNLRLIYAVNDQWVVWTPAQSTWDIGKWDNRGLLPDQCIVLYLDLAKVTPLLPCNPIAKAQLTDQPWRLKFDVMGPREERRGQCGSDTPPGGPVLCLLAG
jgi:hypothetical protein